MKALQIVAAALGKSLGGISVTVDPKASTAYTNGKKVVLPVLPILADEERADVTLGLVCHESFHIRHTYLGGRLDGRPPAGIDYTPLKKRIQNALEDARIEHRGFRQYPGSRKFLDTLVAFAIREGWFRNPRRNTKPGNLVLFGLLFHYRAGFLEQHDLDNIAQTWEKKAIKTFGKRLWWQMLGIADNAVVASGPEACWLAADQICALLAGEDQEEDPDQESGSSSDSGEDAGSDDSSDSDDSELDSRQKAAKEAAASGEDDLDQVDLAEMVPVKRKQVSDMPPEPALSQPLKEHGNDADRLNPAQVESQRIYRKICGPLEAKLWARAQEEEWVTRTGTSGVVSSSLYAAHTTGRVFRTRVEGDSRSMTVHLLLDNSGSMGDVMNVEHSSYWAAAGALALVRLFASLGIDWSASWFDDVYYQGRGYSSAPMSPRDPWELFPGGYTDLPLGMSEAGKQLVCETETDRKLLLVLTDGGANESDTSALDAELMRQGIEVRYVLIGALAGFYFAKDRVSHGELADTAKAMIGAFRSFV
ncbi:hypothetical protein B1757_02950 [Acidithiobacillus marinus]|uniref:VWFA domain-containing protein n=1 Tax=Acidithiobacillus marinus TaxID=187490 RepID=A0A2I1DPD6_9PROT|nr:hypothetical protein [Acidithiobacillus marinus]PKY11764.1 hypothetical protein B1757_02950 [Acidithiobacillus marinus]